MVKFDPISNLFTWRVGKVRIKWSIVPKPLPRKGILHLIKTLEKLLQLKDEEKVLYTSCVFQKL